MLTTSHAGSHIFFFLVVLFFVVLSVNDAFFPIGNVFFFCIFKNYLKMCEEADDNATTKDCYQFKQTKVVLKEKR